MVWGSGIGHVRLQLFAVFELRGRINPSTLNRTCKKDSAPRKVFTEMLRIAVENGVPGAT